MAGLTSGRGRGRPSRVSAEARIDGPFAPVRQGQKTYWHLLAERRIPSEYQLVSSRLGWIPSKGISVETPGAAWFRRHQPVFDPSAPPDEAFGSAVWEAFSDPRGTTYRSYVALQREREAYLQGLLDSIEGTAYDREHPAWWYGALQRIWGPLRYPCHGLQLLAAYGAQMAPASRITIAGCFQMADELRRVSRLAYRLGQLRRERPELAEAAASVWQEDPLWQPLRQVLERLLVTYGWAESFVGHQLVLKPLFDEMVNVWLAKLAHRAGDDVSARLLGSFADDARWHQAWTFELARLVLAGGPESRPLMDTYVSRWCGPVWGALEALAPLFEEIPVADARLPFSSVRSAVRDRHRALLEPLGMERLA